MTTTTLEVTELTASDVSIECNMDCCSASATRIVCTPGCIHLWCQPCVERATSYYSDLLPAYVCCVNHSGWRRYCRKISEVFISVEPL